LAASEETLNLPEEGAMTGRLMFLFVFVAMIWGMSRFM